LLGEEVDSVDGLQDLFGPGYRLGRPRGVPVAVHPDLLVLVEDDVGLGPGRDGHRRHLAVGELVVEVRREVDELLARFLGVGCGV